MMDRTQKTLRCHTRWMAITAHDGDDGAAGSAGGDGAAAAGLDQLD